MSSAALPLRDFTGVVRGHLRLATRPNANPEALVNRSDDASRLANAALVQVREAHSYRYSVDVGVDAVRLEPAELFKPDDDSGRAGSFEPAEAVGYLEIQAFAGDAVLAAVDLEVRAAKLEHDAEYGQMLRDVSEFAAEALMQGFQPAAGTFAFDERMPVELLYRRFAMLHARLNDPEFLSAVAHVLARPHNEWQAETEYRPPTRPLGGGSALQRALVRGHPRRDWPEPLAGVPLNTLPRTIEVRRFETTVDTLPNRLVKYALEDWRSVVLATEQAVTRHLVGSPQARGLRATAAAFERLDEWLADPTLRDVGALTTFPQGNQVLLKREGYRQIFAAWMLSSAGADVAIDLDDPLRVSQRNIATLYEYWCFLQLSSLVAQACSAPTQAAALFHSASGGMALGLRQGRESRLEWETTVAGRRLRVELFFNRAFPAPTGSWSRAMRPDCSLRIRPATALLKAQPDALETWLHFDAKYRLDSERAGESKRDDLLKMHAYRDAIRRTAGAYVLFPGTAARRFAFDRETLPGIGAFPLRPAPGGGAADGSTELRDFIAEVMQHMANQATRHERSRFWQARIAAEDNLVPSPEPPMELDAPPADTHVLLVPVATAEQLAAILERGEYVSPTVSAASFVLFHGPGVPPRLSRRTSGRAIAPVEDAPAWITRIDVEALPAGEVTWLELAGAVRQ